MNRVLCCSYFFKVIICLFIIGMIITFINIGNGDIMVINVTSFNVSVQNRIEIEPRQYQDYEYHFTFRLST
ncbi:hypothetical protein DICPUDRAFT_158083 [Dictyostelium purpureum]|uniref:Uncharacterized protein n=1 Tax=Dictyostelium purpureum TaxID=5786 RepID=F1A0S8_DICPU|nr:uncharacterized protein DICPUDRAFT_158083 [Dictyostelium purpureum]EGC30202.1 hypothetical protein DICPUDRAFT_158083 [Dictyostelium purpureum]|eukprot:XP_003293265.1 hypothetical protein DICPUDRAFT_158083 [Dictyostelium purpureum]